MARSPKQSRNSPDENRRIQIARPSDVDAVRALLREYEQSLGIDLCFQDFESEVADPFAVYEVIFFTGDGCVTLRSIDGTTCEMKRLFVRKSARGQGLGRRLAETAIEEGRRRGYEKMLLDTLPQMAEAIALYRSLGFVDTEPYRQNPIVGALFLQLDLL